MIRFFHLLITIFIANAHSAPSSIIDHPGCPENSYCQKSAGVARTEWSKLIKQFTEKAISPLQINNQLNASTGHLIPIWGKKNARENPLAMLWDSPCKNHRAPYDKFFLGELFVKDLSIETENKFSDFHFSKLITINNNGEAVAYPIPRGDGPLLLINDEWYFTKDEDGHFYGLYISKTGQIRIGRTQKVTHFPTEIKCPSEFIQLFQRKAPHLHFYQGTICKNIWNETLKRTEPILIGWSCN